MANKDIRAKKEKKQKKGKVLRAPVTAVLPTPMVVEVVKRPRKRDLVEEANE